MSKTLMTTAVAVAMVVAYAWTSGGRRGAQVSASGQTTAAALAPASSEHAAHGMTAAEHIAHMAAAGNVHAGHAMDEMAWAAARAQAGAAAGSRNLPADDMGVVQRLASSPRKSEFVKIDVGGMPMRTFVVYPDRRDKAPVVVVIQEIFGLSDWIRGVADQLAADGFIAVAPDLLSGHGRQRRRFIVTVEPAGDDPGDIDAGAVGDPCKARRGAPIRLETAVGERQERQRRVLLRREPELRVCRQRGGVECGGGVLRDRAD